MSSFNSMKKQAYSTVSSSLNVVSTSVGAIDKGVQLVDSYLAETLAVREAGKEKRMEQKLIQMERDLIVESQESTTDFYKAIIKNEEAINSVKEKLSNESMEKYKHLL